MLPSGEGPIQSLDRGLVLLEAFRAHATLSPAELSALLPVHRTSTSRLLRTLESHGFVARDPETGRYRLGPTVCELGGLALARLDVRAVARPLLEQLAAGTGETVQLLVRDGAGVVVVDGIESRQALKVGAVLGERRPLHATAAGKCFLAALPRAERQALLGDAALPRVTKQTIADPAVLEDELRRVRSQGYAVNDRESEPGARFVAAPITGADGEVVAALALGGPAGRLPLASMASLGRRVALVAARISALAGAQASEA